MSGKARCSFQGGVPLLLQGGARDWERQKETFSFAFFIILKDDKMANYEKMAICMNSG